MGYTDEELEAKTLREADQSNTTMNALPLLRPKVVVLTELRSLPCGTASNDAWADALER